MEIQDNTLNITFDELKTGMCFVNDGCYYMKIKVTEYNGYTSDNEWRHTAIHLSNGLERKFNPKEKVRLIKTTLIVD